MMIKNPLVSFLLKPLLSPVFGFTYKKIPFMKYGKIASTLIFTQKNQTNDVSTNNSKLVLPRINLKFRVLAKFHT